MQRRYFALIPAATPEHYREKEGDMNANADIRAADQVATHDLYYAVHKGIRLANARMLIALGQADAENEGQLMRALGALSAHLDLGLSHLTHENQSIHTALEARMPGGAAHAEDDHDDHLAAFAELRRMSEAVAVAPVAERAALLRRLYQRFALFVADDLRHMHEEETELMPRIARSFTNDEVMAIEGAIVTRIPPAEMARFLRLILGAASRSERVAMVGAMQSQMPEAAFSDLFSAIVGPDWRAGDWEAMELALC
ncbi:hemerythrin domain-containing protein [Defluviimonas sp. WL0002]|uniref:Hemerythrin domain-containing protein n=1 Tax=Albidovulum marisflavi TaxID=2984159 RepID=A0ABT2ZEK6_9RHOB|nr:hemerythrin domain-containing protein [Defluviimonas sp. WL0002]MCV2869564.1 hemerythrin domain-containing protein [Defluviimonas sp. WL0002]